MPTWWWKFKIFTARKPIELNCRARRDEAQKKKSLYFFGTSSFVPNHEALSNFFQRMEVLFLPVSQMAIIVQNSVALLHTVSVWGLMVKRYQEPEIQQIRSIVPGLVKSRDQDKNHCKIEKYTIPDQTTPPKKYVPKNVQFSSAELCYLY